MRVKISNKVDSYKANVVVCVTKQNLKNLNDIELLKSDMVAIKKGIKEFAFTAAKKQILELKGLTNLRKLILVGVGEEGDLSELTGNEIGADLIGYLKNDERVELFMLLETPKQFLEPLILGMKIKAWRFNEFLSVKDTNWDNLEVNIILDEQFDLTNTEALLEGIFLAKELVELPANVLTPDHYVERIKKLESDKLKITVTNKEELNALGMTMFTSVASSGPCYMVTMEYMGNSSQKTPLILLGKGVTFDTGGYSLKSPANMKSMKKDMGGSAAVVGLMHSVTQRKAKINVIGVIGIVANIVDPSANKPDDIVKSKSGKTVEITNTDAEGRLVLGDLLSYAQEIYNPEVMIDLATLTGAANIALAPYRAALYSNSDGLAKQLLAAGECASELIWQMPLDDRYLSLIKESHVADLNNSSALPIGGANSAAMFLKQFVGDCFWAHIDMSYMSYSFSLNWLHNVGATGYGVRLLNQYIKDSYES